MWIIIHPIIHARQRPSYLPNLQKIVFRYLDHGFTDDTLREEDASADHLRETAVNHWKHTRISTYRFISQWRAQLAALVPSLSVKLEKVPQHWGEVYPSFMKDFCQKYGVDIVA